MILVGNKTDLVNERVVSFEEGEEMARSCGLKYIETSLYSEKMSENGQKIDDIFQDLTEEILSR